MYDYYYGGECEEFSFYQMPSVLLRDKKRFGGLSDSAKLLYMVLLDRVKLSRANGWIDDRNRVYIIYTVADIMEDMGWGKNKVCDTVKELDKIGLISRTRRGQGKATVIYVRNFIAVELREPDMPDEEYITSGKAEEIPAEMPSESVENAVESELNRVENCSETVTESSQNCPETAFEVLNPNLLKFENQTSRSLESKPLEVCFSNPINNNKNNNNLNQNNQSFNQFCETYVENAAVENLNDGLIDKQTLSEVESQVRTAIDYDVAYSRDITLYSIATEIKDIMVAVISGSREVV